MDPACWMSSAGAHKPDRSDGLVDNDLGHAVWKYLVEYYACLTLWPNIYECSCLEPVELIMFEKDPRTFEADVKNLTPEQKAMVKLEITLTQFFKSFNTSITRWERLVYPSLLVMAVLGMSGFYLIYNLTTDMDTMTQSIDPEMEMNLAAMSGHMADLSMNIATMTGQITVLVDKIDSMETHIASMDDDTSSMRVDISAVSQSINGMTLNIHEMNQSMRAMTVNTGVMSRDINQMGRPMDFMNSFSPW